MDTSLIMEMLEQTARVAGFGEPQGIGAIVGGLIAVVLSLLGIIFLCLVIYAGFVWMTSACNVVKVTKAKKTLVNAVTGLIIVLSSYSIANFVLNSLVEATIK